jgi:hypothetical protein
MLKRLLFTGCVAALLNACGIKESVRSGSDLQADAASSVLVLGVRPNYRIHLLRGKIVDHTWVRPIIDTPEVNIFPGVEGYVVVKVKPTTDAEKLGVSLIFPNGLPYGPCANYKNPVFTLRPGTVTYVGDIDYELVGDELRFTTSLDAKRARTYLASKYPTMGPFEVHPMDVMNVDSGLCRQTRTTIPVFIPSIRR